MKIRKKSEIRFAARAAGRKIRGTSEHPSPVRQAMQSSVAAGVSSPVEQARQQPEENGDRSPARPKKEFRRKLDARCSSTGEVTGSGSEANASTASVEDKAVERKPEGYFTGLA